MPETPLIDIRPDHWAIVRDILRHHVPKYEVWAFGSRAKWLAKPYSDLDLAIITETALSLDALAALSDEFAESDLPWKVDVVDWATTSETFRAIIKRDKVVVQVAEATTKNDWKMVRLDSLAELKSGGTPSKANSTFWHGDIPWLTPKDMNGFTGFTQDQVTEQALGSGTRLSPAGASYVAVRGMSLHNEIRVVRGTRPMAFNQDIKAIIPTHIDSLFLYYALSAATPSLLAAVESAGHGTGVLPTEKLASLPIPDIALPEQRAIAHILGTLDDKIELNRKTNETLEAIAKALFRSWFVDFDPVRAKVEGRPAALPDDISDLFSDSFGDSELGEVPSNWAVSTLQAQAAVLSRGISPAYCDSGGIVVINQKCIRDRKVDLSKARRHDTSKKPVGSKYVARYDTLVNSTGVGTLGRVSMMPAPDGEVTVDSHVTIIRGTGAPHSVYLAYTLMERESEVESLGEGSTGQTELSRVRLGGMSILMPPPPVLLAFFDQVGPIEDKREQLTKESLTLAAIRDTLLPKLVSGELRVPDAAAYLEAAGV